MTVQEARDATGVSIAGIKRGMWAMQTWDPLLGACYEDARSKAVRIKGDRDKWNRRNARETHVRMLKKAEASI